MQTLHHANARMTAPRIATSSPPILHVTVEGIGLASKHFQFTKPFRIGRSEECEICVKDDHVSRRHAEVTLEEWHMVHSRSQQFKRAVRWEVNDLTDRSCWER